MPGTDQRKHPRFALALPAKVRLQTVAEPSIEACTKDISSKGIYFVMSQNPEPGSELEFEVRLPEEITGGKTIQLRCRGKIVRVDRRESEDQVGIAATIEQYEFIKGLKD